jgi:hypothetical protein
MDWDYYYFMQWTVMPPLRVGLIESLSYSAIHWTHMYGSIAWTNTAAIIQRGVQL